MQRFQNLLVLVFITVFFNCKTNQKSQEDNSFVSISGVYPHLAHYNNEAECGTGAIVPWADRLWVITYGPHLPLGSSDKLYEINSNLKEIVRPESIGGTPANRMVHHESGQLFIGPYVIDKDRNVRVIPYDKMPGRHTGNARHLVDPVNKIYYATMEEGFYEVDVHDLNIHELYKDGNNNQGQRTHDPTQVNPENATLPGAHGKGVYSGQGVLVYANNGEATEEALEKFDIESGVLAEWDGVNWDIIRRNQFVEVTGPGGIHGNNNPETDLIWVTGWDHRSLIVGVRSDADWQFYRLPKASHSYDGAHGWNTEWPRIRNVGSEENPDYLMTMHGMFWHFPATFSRQNSAGIRPRSAYLKVIGDFCRWNDQLVFGCDDSAKREFLNKRKLKGDIEGPGQSNSNLWFTFDGKPDSLGTASASGALWIAEEVAADEYSEPFLFAGWDKRIAWVMEKGVDKCSVIFEIDQNGDNNWKEFKRLDLENGVPQMIDFGKEAGEWIRAKTTSRAEYTLAFNYTEKEDRNDQSDAVFSGLTGSEKESSLGGLLYGLGNDRRKLGVLSTLFSDNESTLLGYYELDEKLNLIKVDDIETERFIADKFAIPQNVVEIDAASILVIDDKNRRWRLPFGNAAFSDLTNNGLLRICREVATERDLFNCHGTFYELPAENADGMAKVRPIASHSFRIHDYASYRGMLVMTGIDGDVKVNNAHIIKSDDGKAAVWLGVIDDLWQLGKPVGQGGPWKNSQVEAGNPSDPYLIGFYDQKELTLSHDAPESIIITAEVEPIGHGPWMVYRQFEIKPGEQIKYQFPEGFQARWIRFKSNKVCNATAWLEYR